MASPEEQSPSPAWIKQIEDEPTRAAWLAVSDDAAAKVSDQYFYHQKRRRMNPDAQRTDVQDALLSYCAGLTGVALTR